MYGVTIKELIKKMDLKNMTPELDTEKTVLVHPDVNRPALQLTGFFDHFDNSRIQIIGRIEHTYMIIGYVEQAYLNTLTPDRRRYIYDKLISSKIPCLLYSRGLEPDECVLELCNYYGVPCMISKKTTSDLMAEVIRWLNVKLAPMISIHGVLVDVFGEGVLIMGESGIGKSEAALELIKRGHRLVSDDVVEIKRVSDDTLIGSAPDITRHFIELRGIGIIDVKTLFGVESVKDTQSIDMVIKLEEWDKDKEYDRLKALADEQIAAINEKVAAARKRMENGTSYLTSCLADFFATVPHKETKTTEKYRLLSGTLTFKKGTTKTKLDETKLVPWLKANGYGELVKVEESTRWADLKKLLSYTGDIATLTETGEIVEGVTVYETPGIFTVDV